MNYFRLFNNTLQINYNMNRKKSVTFILITTVILSSCRKPEISPVEDQDWYGGGTQTVFVTGVGAYSQPFFGLTEWQDKMHEVGDLAFEATFVSAPAPKNQGLGPVFNNVSCFSCHINDGRGKAPSEGANQNLMPLLIRLSISGQNEHGGPLPAPLYGGQLQTRAIFGNVPEATIDVNYQYITETFADGENYELRMPIFTLQNMYAGTISGMMMSPRMAPPVFGMGLLEAIPESTILAFQDVYDADGDGISGRANYVWNIQEKRKTLGRFGWKANNPSILQQVAAAYHEDIGITNFLFPVESSYGQSQYINYYNQSDLTDSLVHAAAFYMRTLAVPARRNIKDPEIIRGKKIFSDAKCTSCHVPKHRTGINVSFGPVSNQLIFPYTDLLVHDMGAGLADNRPDWLANGQEWRTPPLWGIGLTEVVNGHSNFLHDGRARSLMEAILWHGGEAEHSKQYVKNLPKSDREALIKFLKSL